MNGDPMERSKLLQQESGPHLKRWAIALGSVLLAGGIGLHVPTFRSTAVELADGTVYFVQPPSLEAASTTVNAVASSSAVYYFTLNLPENAGEPLQSVTIVQQNGTSPLGEIDFDPDDVRAFEGTRRRRGDELSLAPTIWDEEEHTLTLTFDPPVEPGTDVTLRIEPRRNPRRPGVYLLGVTAFPAGDIAHGQFLGYGRLHFYDRGDVFRFSVGH